MECESVFGSGTSTSKGGIVSSQAICQNGYVLVSCGMIGDIHAPFGTIIKNGNTCIATNIFNGNSRAVARCCLFTNNINPVIITRNGTEDDNSLVKCDSSEILIGCGVSSNTNYIIGSYIGNQTMIPVNKALVPTGNQCIGNGYQNTPVTANAQCAVYNNSEYKLVCLSKTVFTNEELVCPHGYSMTSCSGFTEDEVPYMNIPTPFKHNYINHQHQCIAQQHAYRPLYISIICCQFISQSQVSAKHEYSPDILSTQLTQQITSVLLYISIFGLIINILLCFINRKYNSKKSKIDTMIIHVSESSDFTDSTDAEYQTTI